MDESLANALDALALSGGELRARYRLPWPAPVEQAVHRLRFAQSADASPIPLIAIVGGASSGKSTLFNNLLDGHLASYVTARGHATRGPIVAIHETDRDRVGAALEADRLFPGLRRSTIELDANACGEPHELAILHHSVEGLRGVLLVDTPDFTSEAALSEGDVTLSLLPWFDSVIVVLDHERWFDRQSVPELRHASVRLGQRRFVVFNRTREEALAAEDADRLRQQAERLDAAGMTVLEFRRGRGFCRFAPGTLDAVKQFLVGPSPERSLPLLRVAASAARDSLNQNAERAARKEEMIQSLRSAIARGLPSDRDCMLALMLPAERRQLDVAWRVLRAVDAKEWVATQAARLQGLFRQVPVLGSLIGLPVQPARGDAPAESDRRGIARSFASGVMARIERDATRITRASRFWDEVRAWTKLDPPELRSTEDALRPRIEESAQRFDAALRGWNAKVETECHGLSPNVRAGVGVGMLGLAVVLIAVPGPLTALTLLSAKGAVAAALAKLATVGGAGALFGKQIGRFFEVTRERLVGSDEFDQVQRLAGEVRRLLSDAAEQVIQQAVGDANELVLASNSSQHEALVTLDREVLK